eukprot:GILK01009446.1.p1 GENE.GILK01009446.1~~GILK01009446.1.p1  ORF type:complete len:200 (-),score=37.00 GILK01009446.1:59-658(-)
MEVDFSSFSALLGAPSKDVLVDVFQEAFFSRDMDGLAANKLSPRQEAILAPLEIEEERGLQLLSALRTMIKITLQRSPAKEEFKSSFPSEFNEKAKRIIADVMFDLLPAWRDSCVNYQISLPKLRNIDWRVDVKVASNEAAKLTVPMAVMSLEVEKQSEHRNQIPETSIVTFEMSKEALQTMLDGLGEIREQLASLAQR